jgi:organic radical activating enzyme
MNKPYLRFLDIYCGAFCNLACKHCDARSDVIQTKEFDPPLEEILEGVKLARKHFDIVYYGTSGGEPLLYLDKIRKIFEFIRKEDPTATLLLSTNGTLIDKKLPDLVDLVSTLDINLFVCNHFSAFDDPTLSNKIKKNVDLLVNALGMTITDTASFYKTLFDVDNSRNDQLYQEWLNRKQDMFNYVDSAEKVYYKKTFLHFREQNEFKKNYQMLDNVPKPFNTDNPELSYNQGCSSEMCSFLIDKKLYKCATLGTLKRFLNYYNLLDDADWQKYLNYKFLDLENCSAEEIINFDNTKYCSISECDMCPMNDTTYKRTPATVLKRN